VSQVVFVLEDDADIRRLVQYQLEGAGYVVRAYPAVGSIVQDAERQRPALFLLDIMVPGERAYHLLNGARGRERSCAWS